METDKLTESIIGCAIRVHQNLGPGLLESIYEAAMEVELNKAGLHLERQKILPVLYDGIKIGEHRLDMLIENRVVLELKSVERFDSVFQAQLLGYMKMGRYPVGLLINFNSRLLKHGIKRMVLKE
jgi:GxxExxY protein